MSTFDMFQLSMYSCDCSAFYYAATSQVVVTHAFAFSRAHSTASAAQQNTSRTIVWLLTILREQICKLPLILARHVFSHMHLRRIFLIVFAHLIHRSGRTSFVLAELSHTSCFVHWSGPVLVP